MYFALFFFFFSSRRRHTRYWRDWSSDVCSSDLAVYRESVLYTTLSPCPMCSGAILLYGIPTVIVGENQTFLGDEQLLRSRGVTVTVLQDPQCIRMMTTFIREHSALWNEDIGV